MQNKKLLIILLSAAIYLSSTGVSYMYFSGGKIGTKDVIPTVSQNASTSGNDYQAIEFDQNKPKTEACPINGVKYSKDQKSWWEKHGPLGIMIENHEEARPQSGLTAADIIYESIAEGGITRFLSVFYCQDAGIVGPVRSARTYFMDYISEYGAKPLYVHVGGANCNRETGSGCANGAKADSLGQIEKYGWKNLNDLNGIYMGFPLFKRDESRIGHTVATEHTMYVVTNKIWEYAKDKRDLTNKDDDGDAWDENFVEYSFKDDPALSNRPTSQAIHIEHWENYVQYAVDWKYDRQSNIYLRSNSGKPHMDRNTGKQLKAKDIVVLYTQESSANDGYENNLHLLYKTIGKGNALYFVDGKQTKGTWRKDKRESRTMLLDSSGKEIEFTRGKMWFHILPLDGVVTVQ